MCFKVYSSLNDCEKTAYFGNTMHFFEYPQFIYQTIINFHGNERNKKQPRREIRKTWQAVNLVLSSNYSGPQSFLKWSNLLWMCSFSKVLSVGLFVVQWKQIQSWRENSFQEKSHPRSLQTCVPALDFLHAGYHL